MRRVWAIALGVIILAGLSVQGAGASHPIRLCLDIGPDHTLATSNDDIVDAVPARLGVSDDGHPPAPGCHVDRGTVAGEDMEIDFEITGVADPDSADSPETPDMTCTIEQDGQMCWAYPPSSGGGDQTIRAWVDTDGEDDTVEGDLEEGPDEEETPGAEGEPDFTDVTLWSWSHGDPPPPDDRRFATSVTIRYLRQTTFRGRVASALARCERGRWVMVRRVRRGADDKVGLVRTNRRGAWSLGVRDTHGRFYANARRNQFFNSTGVFTVCAGDRSKVIRVR